MSFATYSDEVAEDYRKALEDLTLNSRYEISNLTVIAKENTEHALAISQALKDHIKKIAPSKKLPALYVLDSVVKNVGTPYTIFLARNLYATFMEAYAMVDNKVRQKMEEMLRTWKEPVPGSIDSRPVFPIETTRPIESALIKARTSALQAQQAHSQPLVRPRPGMTMNGYRQTPTPPNALRPSQYPLPGYPAQSQASEYGGSQYLRPQTQYGGPSMQNVPDHDIQRSRVEQVDAEPYMNVQYQQPAAAVPSWQPHAQAPIHMPGLSNPSLDTLKSDIARLIDVSRNDFAQNLHDSSIQTRLKALLDLQTILQMQALPPSQLAAVKDQVDRLSVNVAPQPVSRLAVQLPYNSVPQPPLQTTSGFVASPAISKHPTLASLGLGALLAKASATPQVQTPPPQIQEPAVLPSPQPKSVQPAVDTIPAQSSVVAAATPDPLAFLNRLRESGLLGVTPKPSAAAAAVAPTPSLPLPNTLLRQVSTGAPVLLPSGPNSRLPEIPNDVELKTASLKTKRPWLVDILYTRLGQWRCNTCGRRFQTDAEGIEKRKAHADWHFKINERIKATASARDLGPHRSCYSDEMDWINIRENAGHSVSSEQDASPRPGESVADVKQVQYVSATTENKSCPICQEVFTTQYNTDIGDFVWMDAVQVGQRVFHVACREAMAKAEATKDKLVRDEGESVLGKRKHEDDHVLRTKIKMENLA